MSKKIQWWLLWHYWKMLTIPRYRRLLKKEAEMDRRRAHEDIEREGGLMKLSDAYKRFGESIKKRRSPLSENEKREAIKKHKEGCCFWEQDEPGCRDWCDCGLVQNDNIPFWAKAEIDE